MLMLVVDVVVPGVPIRRALFGPGEVVSARAMETEFKAGADPNTQSFQAPFIGPQRQPVVSGTCVEACGLWYGCRYFERLSHVRYDIIAVWSLGRRLDRRHAQRRNQDGKAEVGLAGAVD